jgi:acyl-CoA reductase-like NAD-dependent aldehyde dehydrogenase
MTLQSVLEEITKRPGTGDVISIINPVTEEQIADFTDCGEEAVNEAVARAKTAFEAGVWSELPGRARAKIMWRIADLIDEHAEELVAARLAEYRHAVDAGEAGPTQLRRILPLLRGLVLEDQRQRL